MARYIAVAGNVGSGKTTLVRALEEQIAWKAVTENGVDERILQHLFNNPQRWAFIVQMAFLTQKALDIKSSLQSGLDFIIDRSIYEDIEVFAELFHVRGDIDSDQFWIYRTYANEILKDLPPPLAIIYCKCPAEVCQDRVVNRPRSYQLLYPPGHVQRLHELYENWLTGFDKCPVLELDTQLHDTRRKGVIDEIVRELPTLLTAFPSLGLSQIDIFPTLSARDLSAKRESRLQPVGTPVLQTYSSTKIARRQDKRVSKPPPSVYIAAPFTGVAEEITHTDHNGSAENEPKMFALPRPHGIIPPGWYRNLLNDVARSFRRLGYHPILPHRDVNRWGRKELSPPEVGRQCLQLVRNCDMFFGILGLSYGAHVEAGAALGLMKPCILVAVGSETESFIGQALMDSEMAVAIRFKDYGELRRFVNSKRLRREIHRALEIRRRQT